MKRIFLSIIICLTLTLGLASCIDALSPSKCYEQVSKEYPKAEIFTLPGHSWKFIVIDSCRKTIYVETMSYKTPNITTKIVIKH